MARTKKVATDGALLNKRRLKRSLTSKLAPKTAPNKDTKAVPAAKQLVPASGPEVARDNSQGEEPVSSNSEAAKVGPAPRETLPGKKKEPEFVYVDDSDTDVGSEED